MEQFIRFRRKTTAVKNIPKKKYVRGILRDCIVCFNKLCTLNYNYILIYIPPDHLFTTRHFTVSFTAYTHRILQVKDIRMKDQDASRT